MGQAVGEGLDLLPNSAGPVQRAMAEAYSARRQRLFNGARATPKQVVVLRSLVPPAPPPPEPEAEEPEDDGRPTVRSVMRAVCTKHRVSRTELLSMSRQKRIILCRQECCYELRRSILIQGRQISLPEIGRHLGGLDHTTVMHGIKQHAKRLGVEL
jgi:hypothetical protein